MWVSARRTFVNLETVNSLHILVASLSDAFEYSVLKCTISTFECVSGCVAAASGSDVKILLIEFSVNLLFSCSLEHRSSIVTSDRTTRGICAAVCSRITWIHLNFGCAAIISPREERNRVRKQELNIWQRRRDDPSWIRIRIRIRIRAQNNFNG